MEGQRPGPFVCATTRFACRHRRIDLCFADDYDHVAAGHAAVYRSGAKPTLEPRCLSAGLRDVVVQKGAAGSGQKPWHPKLDLFSRRRRLSAAVDLLYHLRGWRPLSPLPPAGRRVQHRLLADLFPQRAVRIRAVRLPDAGPLGGAFGRDRVCVLPRTDGARVGRPHGADRHLPVSPISAAADQDGAQTQTDDSNILRANTGRVAAGAAAVHPVPTGALHGDLAAVRDVPAQAPDRAPGVACAGRRAGPGRADRDTVLLAGAEPTGDRTGRLPGGHRHGQLFRRPAGHRRAVAGEPRAGPVGDRAPIRAPRRPR
jgi:hypothetical protein